MKVHYRVLALSATPGNDLIKIQKVIKNLSISQIEIREEEDPDVKGYLKDKQIHHLCVKDSPVIMEQLGSLEFLMVKINEKLTQIFKG